MPICALLQSVRKPSRAVPTIWECNAIRTLQADQANSVVLGHFQRVLVLSQAIADRQTVVDRPRSPCNPLYVAAGRH